MNLILFKKNINRLIIIIGLGILIHLGILYFTTKSEEWITIVKINYLYLPIIVLLAISPMLLHSLRVMIWSAFLGYRLRYRQCVQIILANDIGSAAVPSIIGGGPIKLGMLISAGLPTSEATLLVLLSTIEDFIFYFIGFLFALFFLKNSVVIDINFADKYSTLLLMISLIISMIYFRSKIGQYLFTLLQNINIKWANAFSNWRIKITDFTGELKATSQYILENGKKRFVISLTLLILQWCTKFIILGLLFSNFNIPFTWFDILIKQWLIVISVLVLPLPGGSGGSEAAFIYLFGNEIDKNILLIMVSIWRFFTFYLALIISILLFKIISNDYSRIEDNFIDDIDSALESK
jgi:glycosyltransferase 2 family protein